MKWFRGWDAATWIALMGALIALLGASIAFWQAQEAHETNEQIRREYQQSSREARVYLAKSPAGITVGRPDAVWSVWNQSRDPITSVWAEAAQGEGGIAWRLGDVDGCSIRGIGNSNVVKPQYLHWIDTNGLHWMRLNWQDSPEIVDARPQPDERREPSVPDQSAGSIPNPNCS
jgi:hypothetical protein